MNKINLERNICGVKFKNPLIAASGTCGFGQEFEQFYPLSTWGGLSLKGTTKNKRYGNKNPRIAETPSGILNSVGLQNPGIDAFIENELPRLKNADTVLIANIAGDTIEDMAYSVELLQNTDIDMIELNISCPNVKKGGLAFGIYPEMVEKVTREVKAVSDKKPLIIKLSPNVADIACNALAAQSGGADAISLINTLSGMSIDIDTRKPILANVIGGLSGPAVKPVALRMVYQVCKAVDIPVIGMGGIMNARDVVEFLLCGAQAVMIGTANIVNPMAVKNILAELENYCVEQNINDINELVGALEV